GEAPDDDAAAGDQLGGLRLIAARLEARVDVLEVRLAVLAREDAHDGHEGPPLLHARVVDEIAQLLQVPGVVAPRDEHDVVEAKREELLQARLRDGPRAAQVGRIVGRAGARRRPGQVDAAGVDAAARAPARAGTA